MKVYEVVANTLDALGVDPLFGVMGDANMRYIATYRDRGRGRYVGAAHEAGAVAMADGYSRLSGRTGFVTITHGPGVTNALTALTEAVRSHSSIVMLTGSTPRQRYHKQWLDLRAAAKLAGASFQCLQAADDVSRGIALAARESVVMRRPVVLDIPASLLDEDTSALAPEIGAWTEHRLVPDESELDAAIGMIASAERPVILAGRGAAGARAEVLALADALRAPVANTVMAMNYAAGHPANLGIFGSESHSLAIKHISRADCVIVLGASLNEYTTADGDLLANKAVVRCDDDPIRVAEGEPRWLSVLADVKLFAASVSEALQEIGVRDERAWETSVRSELATFDPNEDYVDASGTDLIDIRTAMVELDSLLPAARALVTDVGRFKTAPWRHLTCLPGAFTQTGGFGAIGLGLPVAIGAAFARPDVPVVAAVGDGALMMSLAELATIAEHRLPMLLLVANDGSYGAEWQKLGSYGHAPEHALRSWPSFAEVARGFGLQAEVVRSRDDIKRLGPELGEIAAPMVLDIRTDPAVNNRIYK